MWPARPRPSRPALRDMQESDEEPFEPDSPRRTRAGIMSLTSLSSLQEANAAGAVQSSSVMRPPCDCTEQELAEEQIVVRGVTDESMDGDGTPNVSGVTNTKKRKRRVPKRPRNFGAIPEPPLLRRRLIKSLIKPKITSTVGRLFARRIIRQARCVRNIFEKEMCCVSCGLLPTNPVTGKCGHTRCAKCVRAAKMCPCGTDFPEKLQSNILIRDIVFKLSNDRPRTHELTSGNAQGLGVHSSTDNSARMLIESSSNEAQIHEALCQVALKRNARVRAFLPPVPVSPRARYNRAVQLLQDGRHLEAAPYLALVVASNHMDFRSARKLLIEVMSLLTKKWNAKALMTELRRTVRNLCSTTWVDLSDMECIVCCEKFRQPVTTPCGHMFCRACLDRCFNYKKRCPLCRRSLKTFSLVATPTTSFVEGALKSKTAADAQSSSGSYLIPIIACTVGYPSIPCPLFIYEARYWPMLRRVLDSGSRKFGMVACDRGGPDCVGYGTVMEVRDCVLFEDGRTILSTIGLSRFKIMERYYVEDGFEVARVLPIADVHPLDLLQLWDVKQLARQITLRVFVWLRRLGASMLNDMELAFGSMPLEEDPHLLGETEDGPAWVWWLIAVLPLRSEIKVLILATNSLLKRMRAVSCTLEALCQDPVVRAAPLTPAVEPVERAAPGDVVAAFPEGADLLF
ncbi:uncharacterized protein LOC124644955 isoform X1 [Helicoverpa zea]|uniref:uncharacterized protein LOC124644955 isoform X1 n=2 Tax=Helicoverpa zea TaxID=7113 RepID=UPI001F57CB64|nr:uncharacterized protein LOC124644955 isoform X1 [Helicoverpa zea]